MFSSVKSGTVILLVLVLVAVPQINGWDFYDTTHGGKDRVLLTGVNALTLHKGKMSSARRSSAVPQLQCLGPHCREEFLPSVVQCVNAGHDGFDVQWECKADLDDRVRFGEVMVSCEGYDHPDDPYILRGSCGLEYTLELTAKGKSSSSSSYSNYPSPSYDSPNSYDYSYDYNSNRDGWSPVLKFVVFGGIVYIMYKTCIANRGVGQGVPGAAGGYGGPYGGGGGGPYGGGPGNGSGGGAPGSCPPPGYSQPRAAGGGIGGGGFWSGLAAGGLMGYLFNRGRGAGYNTGYGYNRGYTGGYGAPRMSAPRMGGGSFFGSGSGGGGFSGGASSSRSASGFGGTRRR